MADAPFEVVSEATSHVHDETCGRAIKSLSNYEQICNQMMHVIEQQKERARATLDQYEQVVAVLERERFNRTDPYFEINCKPFFRLQITLGTVLVATCAAVGYCVLSNARS